jgi:hypothetical protein
MKVLEQKREIVDWIYQLDNPLVLNNIYNIKKKTGLTFKERFANGLTAEEFKAAMKKRIQNYPNRK